MNTERPDNDDAGVETGAAEPSDEVRGVDTAGASGGSGAAEEKSAPEETGTVGDEAADGRGEVPEAAGVGHADAGRADAEKTADETSVPGEDSAADSGGEDVDAGASRTYEAAAEVPDGDGPRPDKSPPAASGAEVTHSEATTPTPPDADLPRPEHAHGDEIEDRHAARRRSPLVVASVAAAVLLVGGGGAYLAASASGGSGGGTGSAASGGDGTPPPLALDGYSAGGTGGIVSGEPDPYGETYKADGTLPGGPGSAAVYSPQGEVTKDDVARLAKAFGIDATPVAEGQLWKVGGQDGTGPSLQVNNEAPGAWTFNRYAPGTNACQSTLKCTHDPASSGDEPVSVAAAKKAAAPILKAVGQDDAKVDASRLMGAQRVVNADPVVGGLPTYGWTTGLTVSTQGEVVGGSGQLTAPVKGDTYPVLSAQKTLDLMNAAPRTDHRMGIGGCASAVPMKDRLEAPCGSSTAGPPTPLPTPAPVTVEHAVFGLAVHSVNAKQTLVPSWLFEVREAGAQDSHTVTYPAIDPKYLTSSTPTAQPTPTAPQPTGTATPRDVKVDGYTADGKNLTVAFTGGVCADYKATADESADKVTVTVTATPWPNKICIMIAKIYHQTLPLKAPLGDREVVGSDGKRIPVEKAVDRTGGRLPESSSLAR